MASITPGLHSEIPVAFVADHAAASPHIATVYGVFEFGL